MRRLREKSASACSICTCRRWASVCSIYACRCRAMCGISRGVFSSSGPARSGQRSLITNLVLPALSSLDITFAGLTVSDVKFALATGFGGSTFNPDTGPWFKPENNTAHLLITFDLTAVPELASLVLLASGLLRLGLNGRRKRAAHAA